MLVRRLGAGEPCRDGELIGRALESDALDAALSRAVDGSPEIGSSPGKRASANQLIAEFIERARSHPAVLQGGCLDLATVGSVRPAHEALRLPPRPVAGACQADPWPARDEIAATARHRDAPPTAGPAVRQPSVPPGSTLTSPRTRVAASGQARLFACSCAPRDLATERPVVLISRLCIGRSLDPGPRDVPRAQPRPRAADARPDGPDRRTGTRPSGGDVARESRARHPNDRLDLARLDGPTSDAGGPDCSVAGGRRQGRTDPCRSDGNPFFVEELVAAELRGEERFAAHPRRDPGGSDRALPDAAQRLRGSWRSPGGRSTRTDRGRRGAHGARGARTASRGRRGGRLHPDPDTGTALATTPCSRGRRCAAVPASAARCMSASPRPLGCAGPQRVERHRRGGDRAPLAGADRQRGVQNASIAAAGPLNACMPTPPPPALRVALDLAARVDPGTRAEDDPPDPIDLRRRAARVRRRRRHRAIHRLAARGHRPGRREVRARRRRHPALAAGLQPVVLERWTRRSVRIVSGPLVPRSRRRRRAPRSWVGSAVGSWAPAATANRAGVREAIECAVAVVAVLEEEHARAESRPGPRSLGEIDAGIRELEEARRIGEEHGSSTSRSWPVPTSPITDRRRSPVRRRRGRDGRRRGDQEIGLERRYGPHFSACASMPFSVPAAGRSR